MKIIRSEKSYSKQQIKKYKIINYTVAIGCLVIAIFLLVYVLPLVAREQKLLNPMSFFILFLIIIGMILCLTLQLIIKKFNTFFDKNDDKIGIGEAGKEGEEAIEKKLHEILDNSYTAYPNYKIPGRNFDMDFLIVGPKGLIAMEVKNVSDAILFFENKAVSVRGSGNIREIRKLEGSTDPRNKFGRHCKLFNEYLYYLGLDSIRVKKVLVFIKNRVKLEEKPGIFIVTGINELEKYFSNLKIDDRFTPEFCEIINKKLKKINNNR